MSSTTRYTQKPSQNEALSLTRQALGLPPCSNPDETYNIKDAVIISIDFENVERLIKDPDEPYLKTQMGVCILDTKNIGTSPVNTILRTYSFTTGVWRDRDNDFLFGQTQPTVVRRLSSELEKLIDRKRNNILLAHDCASELEILGKLGFDLKTGISAILDTQQITKRIYKDIHKRITLEDLLNKVGIQHNELHVGGNDANFTLKALMLLVVNSFRRETSSMEKQVKERLGNLAEIGNSQLPERRGRSPANDPETHSPHLQPKIQPASTTKNEKSSSK